MEPIMLMNPREIIASVGEWAQRQPWHPKHAPDLGVAEELGEACHAVLKNYQGIRGFDDTDKFHAALKDAIGDVMVYLSHWCFLNGVCYNIYMQLTGAQTPIRKIMSQAFIGVGHILSWESPENSSEESKASAATLIAKAMQFLAASNGWDLIKDCLAPTWHKVRKRDWNKSKMDGGDAEVAAGQAQKAEEKAAKERPTATEISNERAAISLLESRGFLTVQPAWLEARGYTAPYFASLLEKQHPASALEQGN